MAVSGKRLDEFTRKSIESMIRKGYSIYRIAKEVRVSEPTVRKIRELMLTSFGNACS